MQKSYKDWKNSPDGMKAAADAENMTKAERIAEIMRILMTLAGEPKEAILSMQLACLRNDAERETQ